MQPAFTVNVPLTADELISAMRAAINTPELRGHAVSAGQCVEFMVDEQERRFWSPHLSVQVYESESGQESELYCRFAPRPEVWTMFMFFYFLAAFAMCAAGIYGYVQRMLEQSPWAWGLIPVGLVTIAVLHIASLVGQGLSSDQMMVLRQRFDRALEITLRGGIS